MSAAMLWCCCWAAAGVRRLDFYRSLFSIFAFAAEVCCPSYAPMYAAWRFL